MDCQLSLIMTAWMTARLLPCMLILIQAPHAAFGWRLHSVSLAASSQLVKLIPQAHHICTGDSRKLLPAFEECESGLHTTNAALECHALALLEACIHAEQPTSAGSWRFVLGAAAFQELPELTSPAVIP